ncbi:MAG: gamma-glutamyltransferase [Planctomycetota bacterium]|jgi:gamma-glutamyltranspeptidase/glutathione hydrolase
MRHAPSLVGLLILTAAMAAQDRPDGKPFATRSEAVGKNGMAATSHPVATQVALEILKKGGTAVDAAIAANAILCVGEPTGCGLGGDIFAIVWDQEQGKLFGLNGSGRSPHKLTRDHLLQQGLLKIPSYGPLPVTVPGCVDGWFALHRRFGKLAMTEVLAPAVRYAQDGIVVPRIIAHYWRIGADKLQDFAGFADVFMPNGRAPKHGELFQNAALGRTLERLGREGRDVFYTGDIARAIVTYLKDQGGHLDLADLKSHRSEWIEPVSTNYRGYDVYELPPNGQGIAALQMLNILEAFDLRAMGFGSAEYLHLLIEAKKLAFEDRARWYADPAFGKLPTRHLISKAYAAERRKLIDKDKAQSTFPAYQPPPEKGDTVYLTVADRHGNMVSLIQSNYRGLGSGMTIKECGFILQDRGELFTLTAGHPNCYAPGKRPFHTIIPAFVMKAGKPYMSFGVMGGAMQPQGHVQILVNHIDFGMNLQEAGDAPRIRHTGSSQPTGEKMSDGGELRVETGFDADVLTRLRALGHNLVPKGNAGFGGYQAIRRLPTGVYVGASEPRKDGYAAGY